jgi:hypothetical protein
MVAQFRETLSAIPLESCYFLTEDLTVREVADVLDQLSAYGGERALIIDFGVRQYLLNLLRAKLSPSKRGGRRRVRSIRREVPA